MLDLYFSHRTRLKQMRNGPLTPHLDALAARLHAQGYRPSSARAMLGQAGDFNRMLGWRGLEASDVTPELVATHMAAVGTSRSAKVSRMPSDTCCANCARMASFPPAPPRPSHRDHSAMCSTGTPAGCGRCRDWQSRPSKRE
jgi:hypothetical protein